MDRPLFLVLLPSQVFLAFLLSRWFRYVTRLLAHQNFPYTVRVVLPGVCLVSSPQQMSNVLTN
jgi:hypothetical protein